MRLEKIKLAGFKSFVDPTTVSIPSNLVGIVGPNGCGKSNVIDAVRWVMGESSAKMLRGESMADVIFNGSSARKPVGNASIELVFDNTQGRAGGQYAKYNQIAIRRTVSRDGQSNYFLNGTRCRRRDITDLFLGTGLGPRSYSIIEQGMISRLIEARPEELRVFLEEAAGISKYKERRKETESRIKQTRENLDRLNDLRDEVNKQLRHLQRQAATAEKYQVLKREERQVKAELLALRWRALDAELSRRDTELTGLQERLETAVTEQHRLEARIEAERERQTEVNDQFNEVQGRFYALGAEIASLEQAIQYARDSRQRQEQDLRQVEAARQELEAQRNKDEQRLLELQTRLREEEPRLNQAQVVERELQQSLTQAELAMQSWQNAWDQFNLRAAQPAQTAQVERTRINHLEQQGVQLERRLQRLDEELGRLDDSQLQSEISQLEAREKEQQSLLTGLQGQLGAILESISQQRELNSQLTRRLDQSRSDLQAKRGRRASLEALQQAALGKSGKAVSAWLDKVHLNQAMRLAQTLEVEPRWRRAVEIVLGFYLQAVCVDGLEQIKPELASLQAGSLILWDTQPGQPEQSIATAHGSLLEKVKAPWSMRGLLAGIELAEDLDAALARRSTLAPGHSIVTPDGYWLGAGWLRITRELDDSAGVLGREEELRALKETLERESATVDELAGALEQGRQALHAAEQNREQAQNQFNGVSRELSTIQSNLTGKRTRAEHLHARRTQLKQEQQEIRQQIEKDKAQMDEVRHRLHRALEEIEDHTAERETLVHQRDDLRNAVTQARERFSNQGRDSQQIALQVGSMRTAQQALQENLERTARQHAQLVQRQEQLQEGIAASAAPLQEQANLLDVKLQGRLFLDKELSDVRNALESLNQGLREMEQQRQRQAQEVEQSHTALEQARLQRQEILVRAKTLQEQLREQGQRPESLFETMPEEANEAEWQERVERLAARIERLGPINLAAIDEFKEQSERITYLDAQHADISQSLETLENAIRKIDRETRSRFKDTFEQVNAGIKELFPRLFGGGHAYLEMTGEDLLDTGVTVMARPPGKRNSSIQLLSGGEKALTAVAMVFAIFQLNPAPFCMLDEVDAPLDDANVGRFCDMVKAMSEQVQFIFITHNKITMEIANQLTGVTMHEPGVSRLVTVDVEEAAQMAAM